MKVILAVLGCVAVVTSATQKAPDANKCDDKIIAAIKSLGKTPTGIISTSVGKGKEVVVATTPGYYPTNIKCVWSVFPGTNTFTINFVKTDGSTSTNTANIFEKDGAIIDKDTQTKRYQVHDAGGCSAYYKCHDAGKVGAAEGLVKIKATGVKQADVDKAIAAMNKVGMKTTHKLPNACP